MTDTSFELNAEALGKMVAEVGAKNGPGSSDWNAATSDTQTKGSGRAKRRYVRRPSACSPRHGARAHFSTGLRTLSGIR